MTQRYRKFKRTWGTYYAYDNFTGNSVSLKTKVKAEAVQKVNAMNETERQPGISLGLAKVYLNATDPKLAKAVPKCFSSSEPGTPAIPSINGTCQ